MIQPSALYPLGFAPIRKMFFLGKALGSSGLVWRMLRPGTEDYPVLIEGSQAPGPSPFGKGHNPRESATIRRGTKSGASVDLRGPGTAALCL